MLYVEITELFATNLRRIREEKGITQASLAEKANLPAPVISRWESGERWIEAGSIQTLARILGVKVHEFFSVEESKPVNPLRALRVVADQMGVTVPDGTWENAKIDVTVKSTIHMLNDGAIKKALELFEAGDQDAVDLISLTCQNIVDIRAKKEAEARLREQRKA